MHFEFLWELSDRYRNPHNSGLSILHCCWSTRAILCHFIFVTLKYRFSSFVGYWERICLAECRGVYWLIFIWSAPYQYTYLLKELITEHPLWDSCTWNGYILLWNSPHRWKGDTWSEQQHVVKVPVKVEEPTTVHLYLQIESWTSSYTEKYRYIFSTLIVTVYRYGRIFISYRQREC